MMSPHLAEARRIVADQQRRDGRVDLAEATEAGDADNCWAIKHQLYRLTQEANR